MKLFNPNDEPEKERRRPFDQLQAAIERCEGDVAIALLRLAGHTSATSRVVRRACAVCLRPLALKRNGRSYRASNVTLTIGGTEISGIGEAEVYQPLVLAPCDCIGIKELDRRAALLSQFGKDLPARRVGLDWCMDNGEITWSMDNRIELPGFDFNAVLR